MRELKSQGRSSQTAFISSDQNGVTAHLSHRLMEAYGSRAISLFPPFSETAVTTGPVTLGRISDIANATYLLSFGTRFLEVGESPISSSLAYGDFRRSVGKPRGKFVQV